MFGSFDSITEPINATLALFYQCKLKSFIIGNISIIGIQLTAFCLVAIRAISLLWAYEFDLIASVSLPTFVAALPLSTACHSWSLAIILFRERKSMH